MSRPSLQEQLQALSLESLSLSPSSQKERVQDKRSVPAVSAALKKEKHQPSLSHKEKSLIKPEKPVWLERARYGVALLRVHFPLCFKSGLESVPLKVGIHDDLVRALGGREDITVDDKACMVSSLSYYVNSFAYHQKIKEGAQRIDLEGNPAGHVTAAEASYSSMRQQAKRKKHHKTAATVESTASD